MRTRTIRGTISGGLSGTRALIQDDNDLSTGWIIDRFQAWSNDGGRFAAWLEQKQGLPAGQEPSDNTQIGWCNSETWDGPRDGVLDPDHLIVRDLFIRATVLGDTRVHYMITMHKVAVDDVQAVMSMIKESAQNVPRSP